MSPVISATGRPKSRVRQLHYLLGMRLGDDTANWLLLGNREGQTRFEYCVDCSRSPCIG
jgi:hypothetical protein